MFGALGTGLSPFPFALIFPQDEHERVLIARLAEAGVAVERRIELLGFKDTDSHVLARLRSADGTEETCEVPYLAGCDGVHSTVRDGLEIGFPGGTYEHLFYVADVDAHGPAVDGQLHGSLDEAEFVATFPLKGDGRARFVGVVREEAETKRDGLTWDDGSAPPRPRYPPERPSVSPISARRAGEVAAAHREITGTGQLIGLGAKVGSAIRSVTCGS